MNAPFKQDARTGRLTTDLGGDILSLLRFDGEEHMNALFTYRIEALSVKDDIDFDALIGTHATVALESFSHPETHFDGIITQAQLIGPSENGWRYEFVVRPWFWLLGLRRKQQIFHNRTVVQILEEVFGPYKGLGNPAVEDRLTGDYPILEYTVQYRENDLDFATRLMERFGINYHFVHADRSHALVLSDTTANHDEVPEGERRFHPDNESARANEEHFWKMRPTRRMTTGAIPLTDYNFKTPNVAMETSLTGNADFAEGQIESYDYPGDYLEQDPGKRVAKLRTDQARGQDRRHHGVGDCITLRAGHRLTIGGAAVKDVSDALCLSARHAYTANSYGTGVAQEGPSFEGRYLFMPSTSPLAPERKTKLSVVQGPQTAVVVGEGEIDCDEFGRILVKFHWDLDARHSMRCRVSQNSASKGWGGMVIPRIGMEVVVEFLAGDPDKLLVTGSVFNGANDAPYPLPANKTKSVLRSDSHKSEGFNELTFEDATGEENISLHAQKDQTLKVLNNRSKRVDNNQFESIGKNKAVNVGKNHQENIGGSRNLSVGSGGFGLMGVIGSVAAAGGQDAAAGSAAVGNPAVSTFVSTLAAAGVAVEAMTGSAARKFEGAGAHRAVAGAEQIEQGADFGNLLSKTMPMSGVMNTVVEKFVSDTIGLARTEQIGAYKNTSVGHTMTLNVGKEFIINCGKSNHHRQRRQRHDHRHQVQLCSIRAFPDERQSYRSELGAGRV